MAKSAYIVLAYQTMRILVKCFGALDETTCLKILSLRQCEQLFRGELIGTVNDFRAGSLADGPLTAIGRILHYACSLLWEAHEGPIRQMASRQQVLLQELWIARLSEQVDRVLERIPQLRFRQAVGLEGPRDVDLAIDNVVDLIR